MTDEQSGLEADDTPAGAPPSHVGEGADRPGERPDVRAAGGVVVRRKGGREEVALIHRPKYDDWSLPKGKVTAGEEWEAAALREVEEETGQRCTIEREVAPARYVDGKGRRKLVRYWRMRRRSGRFAAGEEVDELRWLEPKQARRLLTYPRDRDVLKEAFERPD